MKTIHIDSVEILDWYDGVVVGLTSSAGSALLIVLLAFDPDNRRRRYALIPASRQEVETVRSLLFQNGMDDENGPRHVTAFPEAETVYLTNDDINTDSMLNVDVATESERRQVALHYDSQIVQAVSDEAITTWLGGRARRS